MVIGDAITESSEESEEHVIGNEGRSSLYSGTKLNRILFCSSMENITCKKVNLDK